MRLNIDYVRDVLLYAEKNLDYEDSQSKTPTQHKELTDWQITGDESFNNYDKQELTYAVETLVKSGFFDLAVTPIIRNGNLYNARIVGLTWAGHELLDNLRNPTILEAVKEQAKKTGGASIGIIAKAAEAIGIALMSDPNAIENLKQGIINLSQMIH